MDRQLLEMTNATADHLATCTRGGGGEGVKTQKRGGRYVKGRSQASKEGGSTWWQWLGRVTGQDGFPPHPTP